MNAKRLPTSNLIDRLRRIDCTHEHTQLAADRIIELQEQISVMNSLLKHLYSFEFDYEKIESLENKLKTYPKD